MTVAVTVSTPDASPTAAPFRFSRKAGHDRATVTIVVTGTGPVYAYKIKRGGSAIINGVSVDGDYPMNVYVYRAGAFE
jgi:hypothetical protein